MKRGENTKLLDKKKTNYKYTNIQASVYYVSAQKNVYKDIHYNAAVVSSGEWVEQGMNKYFYCFSPGNIYIVLQIYIHTHLQ